MPSDKTAFALFFGNRGFFPASLIAEAREELPAMLKSQGHESLILDAGATRYGAVESPAEGERFAAFLRENRGKYDGVIVCLPNFGDETGAVAALKDAGVPLLIHAYPDDLTRMAPELRRDAFCGKLSVMDVLRQYGVPFTNLKPHVVKPSSAAFRKNIEYFDSVCKVVKGVRGMTVGAIGARTTAFKTVRIDELALQRHGITVETLDMGDVLHRLRSLSAGDGKVKDKASVLGRYASWDGVPEKAFDTIVKLGVVLDTIIDECRLNALALRCWMELEAQLGISPCVILSELNDRGFSAACEVDVGNAVTMRALACASGGPSTCLDWNNNYAEDEDKCILFHCGPVPARMMSSKGKIVDHAIIANALGKGCGYGCDVGRIASGEITFGSMATEAGKLKFYLGEGRFTNDVIPDDFFGCGGVAEIRGLQDVLLHVGEQGHRHHVSVTTNHVMAPVREALTRYLGCEVTVPQA